MLLGLPTGHGTSGQASVADSAKTQESRNTYYVVATWVRGGGVSNWTQAHEAQPSAI